LAGWSCQYYFLNAVTRSIKDSFSSDRILYDQFYDQSLAMTAKGSVTRVLLPLRSTTVAEIETRICRYISVAMASISEKGT
jgi:hypothetical protein